ncbi:MAG: DnaJ C-terminal domain-containing protein, partial [Patescibacteria group bacterium]
FGFDGFNVNFGGRDNPPAGGGFGSIFEDLFESTFSQVQVQLQISIPQAVLGDTVRFKTNFGDEIELRIPPATPEGQSFRFRGKGQQFASRRTSGRGDLTVVIHIEIPKHLSREQRELYEQLKRTN